MHIDVFIMIVNHIINSNLRIFKKGVYNYYFRLSKINNVCKIDENGIKYLDKNIYPKICINNFLDYDFENCILNYNNLNYSFNIDVMKINNNIIEFEISNLNDGILPKEAIMYDIDFYKKIQNCRIDFTFYKKNFIENNTDQFNLSYLSNKYD